MYYFANSCQKLILEFRTAREMKHTFNELMFSS